ncbi:RodZ domain-containing protein [Alteromonas lipolytica]|uniref:HTH cro/C1-type domain-containing protein n=1 Tax=Alteromonas lipolytica TaxID=1856405 RepID=A0A1E8F9H8_9ALTE|nr:RodZ domain-containing protein [Alteromonas lipolytica]OFI32567.1 hypothetical protein BFC17_05285 [Alteromonas lipolytica]GGF75067.1 XRE family transcriptional regulator [Alteromonas lipolytica]
MDKEQHIEADEQHVPATPSPGQVLREAREEQGLTQQAIADKLYLKVGIIDDLEQNRLDDSTSVTFTKGYVRLYAKNVGLNAEELLKLFDQYHTTPKPPAKLQSFSRRVAKQAHDDRWMMVTYGIAVVLIAGVVVWWYQQPANEADSQPVAPKSVQSQPQQSQQKNAAAVDDSTVLNDSAEDYVSDEAEETVVADNVDALQTNQQDDTEALTPEPEINEPVVSDPASDLNSPDGAPVELVFNFNADCWVNINDASGEAIAYGVKSSGYQMRVTGLPPFEVTLGAPSVVEITYDGEAVDMSGFDPTRTAKFSLPRQDQ